MSLHRIPLAAVLGNPVAHSRSPRLHRHWLSRYGLTGDYVALHVEAADLPQVIATLPKMGFVGCNVTIPHKIDVLSLADHVSETARRIGAANTLWWSDDGLHADNTDGYGFIANLRAGAPLWQPAAGSALVLGAGGASRAVLVALLDAGVPQIWLANRTKARAADLAAEFGPRIQAVDWAEVGDLLGQAALVVNTTSLGMAGAEEMTLPLDALHAGQVVTDIVYTPLITPFLAAGAQAGAVTVDGLGMLLHQGVPGFEHWFGQRPEVDEALRKVVLG